MIDVRNHTNKERIHPVDVANGIIPLARHVDELTGYRVSLCGADILIGISTQVLVPIL